MKKIYLLLTLFIGAMPLMASCKANEPKQVKAQAFNPSGNSKTLVAYFSATGNTQRIADRIAQVRGADLYFIEPSAPYAENPYDDSDLIQNEAYNDLRPAVANLSSEEDIAKYDTIFVGSPMWWHQPAMVVCTFLEAYNLADKVIIPFVTYGARTYLNETMQKLYKVTPHSTHVPATLPQDIDPDNIREPQNDDQGIDMPANANDVEDWLRRLGLRQEADAVALLTEDAGKFFSMTNTDNGVKVSLEEDNLQTSLTVLGMDGAIAYRAEINGTEIISLSKGAYLLQLYQPERGYKVSRKVIVD